MCGKTWTFDTKISIMKHDLFKSLRIVGVGFFFGSILGRMSFGYVVTTLAAAVMAIGIFGLVVLAANRS